MISTISKTNNSIARSIRFPGLVSLVMGFSESNSTTTAGHRQPRQSFDNILSRLSLSENIHEIYSLYNSSKDKFNPEHFSVTYRSVGRLLRKQRFSLNREAFFSFQQKLAEQIPNMPPQHMIDFLFMLRAINEEGLNRISKADQELFFKRLNEFIENKTFQFKNLVSIYYDTGVLGRVNKTIRDEVYDRLVELVDKNGLRTLNFLNILLLLRAISRIEDILVKDMQIYNKVVSLMEDLQMYKNESLEDKCNLFLVIAKIYDSHDSVQLPKFMKQLDGQLVERIESLKEKSIGQVIQASTTLPRYFKIGDEIKKVLIDNLSPDENGSYSVEPLFVLDCVNRYVSTRRRRFSPEESDKVMTYFEKNIQKMTNGNIIKLCKLILDTGMASTQQGKRFLESAFAAKEPNLGFFQLMYSFKINQYEQLEKYWLKEKQGIKSYKLVTLYNIVSLIHDKVKDSPIINKLNEEMTPIFDKALNENWMSTCQHLKSGVVDYISTKLCSKILDKLKNVDYSDMSRVNLNTLVIMLLRCSRNKALKEIADEVIQKAKEAISLKTERRHVYNGLVSAAEYVAPSNYLIMLKIAELSGISMISLLLETDLVRNTSKLFFVQRDILKQAFKQLNISVPIAEEEVEGEVKTTDSKEASNQEGKKLDRFEWSFRVEKLIKKFEEQRIDSVVYYSLLERLSNAENIFHRHAAGPSFVQILHNKGLLNQSNAPILKKSITTSRPEGKISQADFMLAAVISPDKIPEGFIINPIRLPKLSVLIKFPAESYQDHVKEILEYIEKNEYTPKNWLNLISSMDRKDKHLVDSPVLKKIFEQLPKYVRYLRPNELLRIGRTAKSIGIKSRVFWKAFEAEVQSLLPDLYYVDRLQFLSILVGKGSDCSEHFANILEHLENISLRNFIDLCTMLSETNFKLNTKQLQNLIRNYKNYKNYKNPATKTNLLKLLTTNFDSDPLVANTIKEIVGELSSEQMEKLKNSLHGMVISQKLPELKIETKTANLEVELLDQSSKQLLKTIADKLGVKYAIPEGKSDTSFTFHGHDFVVLNKITSNTQSQPTFFTNMLQTLYRLNKKPIKIISLSAVRNPRQFLKALYAAVPNSATPAQINDLYKEFDKQYNSYKKGQEEHDEK